MLNWAQPFNIFCFLDNAHYNFEQPAFECLLAVGCRQMTQAQPGSVFQNLRAFHGLHPGWLFGHLAYDLKNEVEQLSSTHFDGIGFDDQCFFVPEIVIQLNDQSVAIYTDGDPASLFAAIQQCPSLVPSKQSLGLQIESRFTKDEYTTVVQKLQQHILRGDCYEVNFCQEFFAADAVIDPPSIYQSLASVSPNPFSALYKMNDRYCICASPERYFKKKGNRVSSQPIKGTAKRDLHNQAQDDASRQQLLASEKDKSENVMVVDLVRNDLSRVCKKGSVQVEELFGVYSFPQVHQMISTISGELQDGIDWIDIVQASFPMGSMTGAPKKRVMEIIEQYERTRRGLFSGAIGYVDPNGDADFNVVIRSILYNESDRYLSFQAGSAITFYSDAEEEYKECLLKMAAMRQVLQ